MFKFILASIVAVGFSSAVFAADEEGGMEPAATEAPAHSDTTSTTMEKTEKMAPKGKKGKMMKKTTTKKTHKKTDEGM